MQRQILVPAALVLLNAVGALAQDAATTSSSPLGNFLDGVQSGANAVNSAVSAQSPASSPSSAAPTSSPASATSPSAAPATSSAAAGDGGLSNGAKIGIIVGCVIAAVLIIGFLAGICCCLMLRKRRRKRAASPSAAAREKVYGVAPTNSGHDYSQVSSDGHHAMEQGPTAPLIAAGALPHGRHSQAPSLSQHPAMRPSHENPFRDSVGGIQPSAISGSGHSPHSSHHGTGAGVAGAAAAGAAGGYGLHKHHQNKHSQSNTNEPIAHHTGEGLISPNSHNSHHGHGNDPNTLATAGTGSHGNSGLQSAISPNSHHGHASSLAGPAAVGAAGYGASRLASGNGNGSHHSNGTDPNTLATTGISNHQNSGLQSAMSPNSHHNHASNLAGPAAIGTAGSGTSRLASGNRHDPHSRHGNDPNTRTSGLSAAIGPNSPHGHGENMTAHSASSMGHDNHHATGSNLSGPAAVGAAGAPAYGTSHYQSGHPNAARGAVNSSPLGPATGPGLEGEHHHNHSGSSQNISSLAPTTHQNDTVAPLNFGGTSTLGNYPSAGNAQPSPSTYPSNTQPTGLDHHNALSSHSTAPPDSGLNTLPSSNRPAPHLHTGLKAGAGGTALAGAAAYGVHQHEEEKRRSSSRSRSLSHSRPRSGTLPTRNNADRPPTPFGLSGIGKPYEDMHVHVLQNEAPSTELQRSLQNREESFAAGVPSNRSSRGYSTPPLVPSRSPNREKRSGLPNDSSTQSSYSNGETSSNSGGEQYSRVNDPYQPATPHRASAYVPPWEQHQTRFSSGSPPTSAGMIPPPVPWESSDYAQQRRQSHSPRQSMDASGRRHSRSPATSINGQPRRLRFEDLQPDQVGDGNRNSNEAYGGNNQHNSYDGYGQQYDDRYSGIGEAH